MRLLLLNVLIILTTLIYVNHATRMGKVGKKLGFVNSALTAEDVTAVYEVSSPKAMVNEMVNCNVTFFPLEKFQKSRKMRRKLRKYYYRYMRKWRRQQKKLKKKKGKKLQSDKRASTSTNLLETTTVLAPPNQTCATIISSNLDYLITEHLFEGDIIVSSEALKILTNETLLKSLSITTAREVFQRSTTTQPNAIWPTTIPYAFDSTVDSGTQAVIEQAIQKYEANTCLTFRSKDSQDVDYLEFTSTLGCSSFVGRTGGSQPVSISQTCSSPGSAEHEIAHALGLFHMHSRHDRSSYVNVYNENIMSTSQVNFASYDHDTVDHKNVEYDYKSVMHYGELDYSKNGEKTIESKSGAAIGVATGLSYLDLVTINLLYQCHEHTPHYWNFDGFHPNTVPTTNVAGTTVVEKYGSGNSIELVRGQRKNALHIDGSYYLSLGNFPNGCIHDPSRCNNGLSVMFWFKLISEPQPPVTILSSISGAIGDLSAALDEGFAVDYIGSYFEFIVAYSGTLYRTYSEHSVPLDTWHHVAMVWDKYASYNEITGYLDGQTPENHFSMNENRATKAAMQNTVFLNRAEGGPDLPNNFAIDDLVIYEKPVTSYDVQDIKDNGPYHDKPIEEGSAGEIDSVIPQLVGSATIPWV